MITAELIKQIIYEKLQDGPLFFTRVHVKPGNKISVFLDGDAGVAIDDCVSLSRYIESKLNRDKEDFELEVSSHGVGQPLEIPRQFIRNVGHAVRILLKDGTVIMGKMLKADEHGFIAETMIKEKPRAKALPISRAFQYSECKEVKIIVSFK